VKQVLYAAAVGGHVSVEPQQVPRKRGKPWLRHVAVDEVLVAAADDNLWGPRLG
jgi:hypothetical protein